MGFFDVVNIYGLLFAVIILVPHIVFAKTRTYDISVFDNRAMLYIERIGKYCSIFLMAINIGVLEEGFTKPIMETFWLITVSVLSILYVGVWVVYFKRESKALAYILTILPAIIFMLSGLLQVKVLLLTAGVVFLAGQLYMTKKYFDSRT